MLKHHKNKKINFLKGHDKIESLLENIGLVKRPKKNPLLKFIKFFLWLILILIIVAVIFSGIIFFKFKGLYDLALSGKGGLENSIVAGKNKDFGQMLEDSQQASAYFGDILKELEDLRQSFVFKKMKIGDKELADLEYIAQSAEVIGKSLAQAAALGQEFQNVMSGRLGESFSEFTPAEKQRLLKLIYESGPELNGVKANLELALLNLDKVDESGILLPIAGKLEEIKGKLQSSASFLSQATIASQILPEIFGYPEQSNFLFLFQNSDELRPTGGFLGTYGILQTKNGDIIRFDTHDIYHMDMPLEAAKNFKITPPEPIKKYLNKNWYMRDANWSPDWPASAEQILWFYDKENALLPPKAQINNFTGKFNGVIAVTPALVESLLELTGPLSVKGEIYDKNNFTKLLEYKVEQDYAHQDISSWERKEIISDILEELKIKLFNLRSEQWLAAGEKLNKNIEQKNILVYFRQPALEELAKKMNFGGEIKNPAGDYLMIVDSNMAALKTDAVMERNIDYRVEEKSDGRQVKLKISYAHQGGRDWRTDDYKSYTRIYIPKGAKVIKADGFIYEKAKVGEDLGKTVIEGFVLVRVGKKAELNFEYILPPTPNLQGEYRLYVQKQPGNRFKNLKVDYTALNAIKSYEPAAGLKINGKNIIWNSTLEKDKEFKIDF